MTYISHESLTIDRAPLHPADPSKHRTICPNAANRAAAKSLKKQKNRQGLLRPDERGEYHALDHRCGTRSPVASGMITSTTIGGFLHVLLVIAVIVVVMNLLRGKKKAAAKTTGTTK